MMHRSLPIASDWPQRRVSPEMARELREAEFHSPDCGFAFGQDRLPEAFDPDEPEPQTDSADGEVFVFMLKGLAVVCGVLFCAWVIAGGPNA